MNTVSKWIESVGGWFGRTEDRDDSETDAGAEPREAASLFSCPDCDSVYIAIEKDTCSTCETSVEEIPPARVETA